MPARRPAVEPDPFAALADELRTMGPRALRALLDGCTEAELETIEMAVGTRGHPGDRYFPEARDKQEIPPGVWLILLIMAGRGFGKTRTGAEWIVDEAIEHPAAYAIVAPTFAAGRDICVEGRGDDGKPSGVLSVLDRRGWRMVDTLPPDSTRDQCVYVWGRSMGELRLAGGGFIKVLSAEQPERIRGWNLSGAWADELGSWERPDSYDQLRFTLRVGKHPRLVITTTPRPRPMIRALIARFSAGDETVIVRRGTTDENRENLSAEALAELEDRYGGTRLGRQELGGELLDDVEGALWKMENIERIASAPPLARIMIGLDPSTWGEDTGAEHSTVGMGIETGIIVVGITSEVPARCVVLDDLSGRHSPDEWGRIAVRAQHHWQQTAPTWIVPETNAGGAMVTNTIRSVDPSARIFSKNGRAGVHAAKGKRARAEPVAALYEQHRCPHLGTFPILEEQMTSWDASMPWSPDRVDALVWAVTALKPWVGAVSFGQTPTRLPGKPKPAARSTGGARVGRPQTRGSTRLGRRGLPGSR